MRVLNWILFSILTLVGVLGVLGYFVALAFASDRVGIAGEYGALFAFSVVAVLAGSVALLALIGRLPARFRMPGEWFALAAFVLAVSLGFAVILFERFIPAGPVIAVIAAAALFVFFARVVVRWSPARFVGSRGFMLPAIWGMIGAPVTAGFAQLVTVMMLVSGGAAGLYFADAALIDEVGDWLTQAAESADLSVIETPSIAFGAIGLLGVTAPLTEELTKFLGVFLVFRKRAATRYGLFVAGAAAGLGFAVVETLGYALMAIEQWPQIMLLRAPVALIHVAGTTIVALGWYKQRQSGGYWLVLSYLLAVVVHAAWNSLFVSMMILAAGMEATSELAPAAALMTLAVVSAMGFVLLGSVLWIVGNARRLGPESDSAEHETTFVPHARGSLSVTTY